MKMHNDPKGTIGEAAPSILTPLQQQFLEAYRADSPKRRELISSILMVLAEYENGTLTDPMAEALLAWAGLLKQEEISVAGRRSLGRNPTPFLNYVRGLDT